VPRHPKPAPAKAGGARPLYPAGGAAGAAEPMGRDVQSEQLRLPVRPLGASGGSARATIDCRGPALGGGYRPGEVLRPGQPRPADGAGGQAGRRPPRAAADRRYLTAGVLADGLVGPTDEGTPQEPAPGLNRGGPLSPLLSNLMLEVLDNELERRGHRFVRGACPRGAQSANPWADDCNIDVQSQIYVQSQRAGALRRAQEGHGQRRAVLDLPSQAEGQHRQERR